jgi:hypothetical protein
MQTPRNQRSVILVDGISSKFYGDLNSVLVDPAFQRFVIDNPIGGSGFMTDLAPGIPTPDMTQSPDGSIPAPAPAAPPPPGALVRGGANSRGFVITLKITSPDKNAVQLVYNQLLGNLMAIWPSATRPRMEYGVAKAMMVKANQIDQDPERLNLLKQQYDSAVLAKKLADQAALTAKYAAMQAMANANPQRPANGQGAFGQGFGAPPLPVPGMPGVAPDANQVAMDPNDAFKDRLTGEDMRKDWEFTVLFAVQLDPPPVVAPAAAPVTPQVSAGAAPQALAQ